MARFTRTGAGRDDVFFDSWGERCAAWFYRPEGYGEGDRVPCVVMGHGWTGIREAGLAPYAERFADAGMAVLVFDYRHFGGSDGEPRQLLDIRRQLQDWIAAIIHARTRDGVDGERIVAWGSSFGGGHVITTAARDHRLAAVVAQVPFVDGLGNLVRLGKGHALRVTGHGLLDQAGALAGRPPHMIPAVGPPGSHAVMDTPDADPGFHRLIPDGVDWPNESAARVTLKVGAYRPIRVAKDVRSPILFQIAREDAITPPDLAEKAAAAAPRSEVKHYPGGHFDVYVEPLFEQVVSDQLDFIARHVLLAGERTTAEATATA